MLLATALAFFATCAVAADPHTLTLQWNGHEATFTARELLARPDVEAITLNDRAAYPRQEMTYRAVKVAHLMRDLRMPAEGNVQFIALDGFTANLDAKLLQNTSENAAIAYLAIEDPANPWPPHSSGDGTAGPYYLFWINPELSNIGREEWPYKFDRIVVRDPVEKLYPEIVPEASAPNNETLQAGFRVFVKNCFTCHTLNGVGPGRMGPDLNHPMSPVEYFRDGILEQFIRNPQSVRANPRTAMGPFPPEILPQAELEQLLAYLRYMSSREKE